jgi:hypothetical protein
MGFDWSLVSSSPSSDDPLSYPNRSPVSDAMIEIYDDDGFEQELVRLKRSSIQGDFKQNIVSR